MKTNVVRVGNSRGIRIPKAVLEQTGLRDEVELEVRGSQVILRPAKHPRSGWEERFVEMSARGHDKLLDQAKPTTWDESEWAW